MLERHAASDSIARTGPAGISPAAGLAVGLGASLALTALKLALDSSIGHPTPYLLYFGAVLAAAWWGGTFAGLVTTCVDVLVGYFLFAQGGETPGNASILGAAGAALECVAITLITSNLRRTTVGGSAAQRDMQAAAAQLRTVMEGAGDGITMVSPSGAIVFANDCAARLTGYASAEEMMETSPRDHAARYELFDEDGLPLVLSDLPGRVLLDGGDAGERLVRLRIRATGVERWVRIRANAVRDERGGILHVVNTFHDVTADRDQQSELALGREWLATALRSIGDAVITTDAQARITFLNPIAEQLTGWTSSDAAGRPLADVFRILHETTRAVVPSPVDRVLAEGVIVGLANHTLLVRRDGSEISIDDSAAPIRSASGELGGVVLVFRDVSVQRRRELRRAFLTKATAELNSSLDYESTLATVARLAVPDIADWCAVDMRSENGGEPVRLAVAHVDPAKIEMVREIEARYSPDPHAPRGVRNVMRTGQPEMMAAIPPELLDAAARDDEHRRLIRALALHSYIAVPIKHGEETMGVITLVMAESNRQYDDEDLAAAMALGDRAAVAIENARLYREAERLRAEAEAASRTKDEFLAMLGHELRNPLAPIVTALHLMDQRAAAAGGPDEGARERGVIRRQLDHVVRLVDDLLDVTRITQGKVELSLEDVEMANVVERALETSAPLLEERHQALAVDVPFGLQVRGDATRLAQVVANLVQNAAKYTEPGGHLVVRAQSEGEQVVLRVSDDGTGIDPALLPQVFDVFTQGHQDAARRRGGLGLGLAIVKSLVRLHGGTVEARSEGHDRGTEIIVRLPKSRASAPLVAAPAAAAERHLTPGTETVLVVDDHADGREMMAVALELAGYRVVTAADGPEALEVAAREHPRIGLLDVGLPGMDGYELARRLRTMPGPRMRLVAVTGYGQESDRARSREAGFDEHLAKPVGIAQLTALLASPQKRAA